MRDSDMLESACIVISTAGFGLAGVAMVFGEKAAAGMAVVAALVWCGYRLATLKLSADRRRIRQERAALEAEWRTLDRAREIRETFWQARLSLREEAQRQWLALDSEPEDQR